MTIKKNDFIEIEFSGRVNGKLFDTTDKKQAEEMGLQTDVKPVIISVGNWMLLEGLDNSLEGKEVGKKFSVHLDVNNGFGKRNPKLIKTIPLRIFKEKNINPVTGMTLQLDNQIVKVISVSGGRIMIDFNNPLAGKEIDYDVKILRKIDNNEEKVNALQDFFFRQRFEFSIKNNKVIFKDEKIKPLVDIMKEKFKEISGFEFEVEKKEKDDKKEGKNSPNQNNVKQL